MKISYAWLKEFLCTEEKAENLAKLLTEAGLEVESLQHYLPPFKGVVIADVRSVEKHPNAERLCVAKVFDGENELQIVCGAPNCRAGMKTALAKIGATLKDSDGKPFTIKKSKLRDVESFGMLCSLDELGLSAQEEGIVEWEENTPAGTDLSLVFEDFIFEISLTPNLGHCMSILGVARELAAKLEKKIVLPPLQKAEHPQKGFNVTLFAKEACPTYFLAHVSNLQKAKTPLWMKQKLLVSGQRPINPLVDISNYVLLELGQPLHFFDKNKVQGDTLYVDLLKKEAPLELLTDKTALVPEGALVIADASGPIALAGIMGAKNSCVTEETQEILIEAAEFKPSLIRKTAKALDLRSESSQRFEKGIDPCNVERALRRALYLLEMICQAKVEQITFHVDPKHLQKRQISCRISRINALLGLFLSASEMKTMLELLEIEVSFQDDNTFVATVPTYRNDLNAEVDIVEEIARMYGLQNFNSQAPYLPSSIPDSPLYLAEMKFRQLLLRAGLQEFMTCDLISPELAKLTEETTLAQSAEISVLHPSSVEQSVLRTSLLPGMLLSLRHNLFQKIGEIHAFELGKVHYKKESGCFEHLAAGILLSGLARPYHFHPKPEEVDFFDLKGIVENIFSALCIDDYTLEISHLHTFHSTRQARIKRKGSFLGVIGEVHPAKLKNLGIDKRVYYAELNLNEFVHDVSKISKVKPLSIYPGSDRDWTTLVGDKVSAAELIFAINQAKRCFLSKVELIAIYKNESLGHSQKSVTFRLSYQSAERTLSNDEIEKEHQEITQEVAKKFTVSL